MAVHPSNKGLSGERTLLLLGSAGETSEWTASFWLWVFFILPPGTSDPLFPDSDLGEIHLRESALSCLRGLGP